MLQVGDEVVLMSAAGRFRVVAIDGPRVHLENDAGVRKTVLAWSVRRVEPRPAREAPTSAG